MPSAAEIAQRIRANLTYTEPDLDTSVGSIAGRFIDAMSSPMAEATADGHMSRYQYDIDSMSAGTLEGFVRLFGMDRRQARYAVGTVTFGRTANTAENGTARIPVGTQIMSSTNPVVFVQTTAAAIMAVGQTTVDVPVRAVVPGAAGNVPTATLTKLASEVSGISTATINMAPLTQGADAESDDTLRNRWKKEVLRNIAGTEQMYRAMSTQQDQVTAVNVLGPKKTWSDRITVAAGTSGPISFGNPDYIYSSGVFVGVSIGAQDLLAPVTDYEAVINNAVTPATITINAVSGGNLADGDYDIRYTYVPTYSRNNPFGTRFNSTSFVNNRIDIWVNGQDPVTVTQSCNFTTSSSVRFTGNVADPLYRLRYATPDGVVPVLNEVFTPLGFGPVISVPDTLVIDGDTFAKGTHYDIVQRKDAFGYGPTSVCGLVWHVAAGLPTSGASFTITYQYNQVPATLQQAIEGQWRLLGTDCMVHAGIPTRYRFHLAVVYMQGFDSSTVNTAIDTAISNLVLALGFDSSLQISDVLQAVHNVPGVDNVRFLNSGDDGSHYAIEQISSSGVATGVVSQIGGRAADVYFDDAHYPLFDSTRILTKTRTNFGAS